MTSLKHLLALGLVLPAVAFADISVKEAWIPEAPHSASDGRIYDHRKQRCAKREGD